MVDSSHADPVIQDINEIGQGRFISLFKKRWKDVRSDHPTLRHQRLHLFIGFISAMLAQGHRIGVTKPNRLLGELDGLHSRSKTDMREINNHTQSIHFPYEVDSELTESDILAFVATSSHVVEI